MVEISREIRQQWALEEYASAVANHQLKVIQGTATREDLLRVTETATKFDNLFPAEEDK